MGAHANSIESIRQEATIRNAENRAGKIIALAQQWPTKEWTDRQMMQALGFVDANSVRPRITEMIKIGVLVETGSTIDALTGKTVRTWRAASMDEMTAKLEQPPAEPALQTEIAFG